MITFEDFMNMSDNDCVKVRRAYFQFLMVKGQLLDIKTKEYWEIFSRYLEIDKMQHYIRGIKNGITSYYLMNVSDIKFILDLAKDIPDSKIAFLQSDIKAFELSEMHNQIKNKYAKMIENEKAQLLDSNANCDKANGASVRKLMMNKK